MNLLLIVFVLVLSTIVTSPTFALLIALFVMTASMHPPCLSMQEGVLSRGTLTRVTAVQGFVSLVRVRVSRPGFVPHSSSSSLGVLVQTKLAQSRYLQTL